MVHRPLTTGPGPDHRVLPRRLALLGLAAGLLPATAGARPLGLREALRARRKLLVAIAPPEHRLPGTEAAGDWAHEFGNAMAALPRDVTASRPSRAGYLDIFAAPVPRGDFATLFLRPDRTGLFHEGPVLDPPTYAAGFAFLDGGDPPPARTGLLPVRARLR